MKDIWSYHKPVQIWITHWVIYYHMFKGSSPNYFEILHTRLEKSYQTLPLISPNHSFSPRVFKQFGFALQFFLSKLNIISPISYFVSLHVKKQSNRYYPFCSEDLWYFANWHFLNEKYSKAKKNSSAYLHCPWGHFGTPILYTVSIFSSEIASGSVFSAHSQAIFHTFICLLRRAILDFQLPATTLVPSFLKVSE